MGQGRDRVDQQRAGQGAQRVQRLAGQRTRRMNHSSPSRRGPITAAHPHLEQEFDATCANARR